MKRIARIVAVCCTLFSFVAFAAKPPLPYFPNDFELNQKHERIDNARWKGRMAKVWNSFEGVRQKFPGLFNKLTEQQKRCLAAHIAYQQSVLYRQFMSTKAPADSVANANLDVEHYRAIMQRYCGPRDPGVQVFETYLTELGKDNVKWTLTRRVQVEHQGGQRTEFTAQDTQVVVLLVAVGVAVVVAGTVVIPVAATP